MEPFSEQLRQAIRDCGTSRYALAKQLGVAESTLSRFLAGERGLTLDVLDKLADVLGLQIITTVQKAQRRTRRGRKRKEPEMMMTEQKHDWRHLAKQLAKDAGENYFSSRRGVWFIDDLGVLCIYNNNPYSADPAARDREIAKIRAWLRKQGIKELACEFYPESGEDAHYTFAILIDAGSDRQSEVVNVIQEITKETFLAIANKKG